MRNFWVIANLVLISILTFEFPKIQAEEISERLSFMPDVSMMIEGVYYSSNKADYSAKFKRLIQADVLRYKDISLGLEFNEETILGGVGYSSDEPYNLRNRIRYLNLRHDGKQRSFGLFYEHTCVNGFERPGAERGWDIIGFELETKNMRWGHKNYRINFDAKKEFEFLSQIGYRVSLGKKITERDPELEAVGELALRWDILRYRNYIPYLQAELYPILGSGIKWDYSLELGTRINYRYAFFSPFLRYAYQHSLDRWQGMKEHFFMAGLRLETISKEAPPASSPEQLGIFPQLHMQGHYANLVGAEDFEWNGNISLNVELFHIETLRGFLNTNLDLLSPAGAYRPRFATYKLEPGIGVDFEGKFLESLFCHSSRHDVNTSDGYTESSGLMAFRGGSRGMRTGYKNEGINFSSPKRFEFLRKIDWQVLTGKFIYTSDYDYDWNTQMALRWDILRHIKKIPYIEGNLNFLFGEDIDTEYFIEAGVRFHDIGDITFFSRYQHKENIDRFGGYSEDYILTGVRFEF